MPQLTTRKGCVVVCGVEQHDEGEAKGQKNIWQASSVEGDDTTLGASFLNHGAVGNKEHDREKTCRNEELDNAVVDLNPHTSTRAAAKLFSLHTHTIQRILRD